MSNPIKAFRDLRKINPGLYDISDEDLERFQLVPANTDELLLEYDKCVTKVFYHEEVGSCVKFLKCLIGAPYDATTKTQMFLAKYDGETVGSCATHMDKNGVAGFLL